MDSPIPAEGSFEEKYKDTAFSPPVEVPVAQPRGGGSKYGLMLGGGALLVVAGLVAVMLVMSGVIGIAGPTEEPNIVYPITPKPSPSPTMPPVVDDTLRMISDPQFNGHLSIRTTITIAALANNGRPAAHSVSVEADMAEGQESGTVQMDNVQSEFRLVNGVFYSRALPNGAWAARPSIPPFLLLTPLFTINDKKQIAYGGATAQHGAAMEIDSTGWYAPDPLKITGIDMSIYSVKVEKETLALFLDNDGKPIYAEFHAWKDASDGTKLINILTTYTFTNLGQVTPGGTPGPSASK